MRVWVPACASGEEAYSIAMLCLDELSSVQPVRRLQLFATDVDEDALDIARRGVYPETIAAEVPAPLLRRHFTRRSDRTYQVSRRLRQLVSFATQDLLGDPPFSRLDLMTCRNLLIYLEPAAQRKVIDLARFALNDGGFLFLGPSETIGRQTDLFETVSKKWRIYRRPAASGAEERPSLGARARRVDSTPGSAHELPPRDTSTTVQRLMLDEVPVAAVLVDEALDVVYFHGHTERYLVHPTGDPTRAVLRLAREGLRSRLRSAIQRARRERERVVIDGVPLRRDGAPVAVRVSVRQVELPRFPGNLVLVVFQDQELAAARRVAAAEPGDEASSLIHHLENELETSRENLQSSIDELGQANEELRASNEEVRSMNEELQSSNEELESSKEELQSVNEELATVNSQLQGKLGELESATSDMVNLLESTEIATIFLDSTLHIRRFTPKATELMNLIPADIGRPIGDITPRFDDSALMADAQEVIERSVRMEREVAGQGGRFWIRRITPYRAGNARVAGVVLTFVEITARRAAEEELRLSRAHLELIVAASHVGIAVLAADGTVREANAAMLAITGWSRADLDGGRLTWDQAVPPEERDAVRAAAARVGGDGAARSMETLFRRSDGSSCFAQVSFAQLPGDQGQRVCFAVDLSERKQAEQDLAALAASLEAKVSERTRALTESEERLRSILHTASDAVLTLDGIGVVQSANPAAALIFHVPPGALEGTPISQWVPAPYVEPVMRSIARREPQEPLSPVRLALEIQGRRADRTMIPLDLALSEVRSGQLFTVILRDISARKELEREVASISAKEQRRIGQELHDSVRQELTGLAMLSDGLAQLLQPTQPVAAGMAARVTAGITRVHQAIKDVCRGLLALSIEDGSLSVALEALASRTRQIPNVSCTVDWSTQVPALRGDTATHLLRIAEEAVSNAVRHGEARTVTISVRANGETLTLTVQDDGRGLAGRSLRSPGVGISVMRSRASVLRGTLALESPASGGTRVACTIPLNQE